MYKFQSYFVPNGEIDTKKVWDARFARRSYFHEHSSKHATSPTHQMNSTTSQDATFCASGNAFASLSLQEARFAEWNYAAFSPREKWRYSKPHL